MQHARTDLKSGATPSKTSPTNRSGSESSKPAAAPADKSTIDVAKEKVKEGWEYVKEKASDAVDAIRGKDECASGECASDKSGVRKSSPPRAGGAVGGQRATAKDSSTTFRPEAGTGRGASESAGVTGSSYKPGSQSTQQSSQLKPGQSDFQSKSGDVAGRGSTSSSQDFSKSSTHEFSKASDLKSGGQAVGQQQSKIGGQPGLQQQSGQQQRSTGGRA